LTKRHLQEHSSESTDTSDGTSSLLSDGSASELVRLDWGASSVGSIAGGAIHRVDGSRILDWLGGVDRLNWTDWSRRGGDCDGARLSIGLAIGEGRSTGCLGWVDIDSAGAGGIVLIILLVAGNDGGGDWDGGGVDLGAHGVGGGLAHGGCGVAWFLVNIAAAAGGALLAAAAAARACHWVLVVVWLAAGGWLDRRAGGAAWVIVDVSGSSDGAGEDEWSEAHLD